MKKRVSIGYAFTLHTLTFETQYQEPLFAIRRAIDHTFGIGAPDDKEQFCFCAMGSDSLLGRAYTSPFNALEFNLEAHPKHYFESPTPLTLTIDVVEAHQGKGVGKALFLFACQEIIKGGLHSVFVADATQHGIGARLYGGNAITSAFKVTHFIGGQGCYLIQKKTNADEGNNITYAPLPNLPNKIRVMPPSIPPELASTAKQPDHLKGYFADNPGHKLFLDYLETSEPKPD